MVLGDLADLALEEEEKRRLRGTAPLLLAHF
jgi:hypothetical protein